MSWQIEVSYYDYLKAKSEGSKDGNVLDLDPCQ
jgi:hypothetical protein